MISKKNIIMDTMLAGAIFLMVLLMLMLNSCKHEPDVLPTLPPANSGNNGNIDGNGNGSQISTCDPDTAYFNTQVLPILTSNCTQSGCHNPTDHKEGVILNNYTNVMATGNVNPGNPYNSKLYEVLIKTDPDDRMPRSGPLSASQINLIYNWIAQGAQNNTCSDACDTNNVTFSGSVMPTIQNSCTGCHSGVNPSGQIDLSSYSTISAAAQNGKLLGSINHDSGFSAMPKGGNKLPDCKIDQIRIWIQNGILNN